ncbi:MAG: hypothetical protein WD069_09900 [Planctomycetales bacterium]
MRTHAAIAQSFLRVAILLLVSATLVGCGPKGAELGTVNGKVTLDGQPVSGLKLEFMPVKDQQNITGEPAKTAEPDLSRPNSVGTTNDNGEFELSYSKGDNRKGAVLGWHMVVFPPETNQKLPPQYSSVEPSAMDYIIFKKVEPGENKDVMIELRSK